MYRASLLRGRFVLRSGSTSDEYFDKFRFQADPALAIEIARAVATLMPEGTDAVAGVELGAVPLATLVSHVTGVPARWVRKRAKEYGTGLLVEGGPVGGLRIVLLEDVVTTGGQLVEACRALRDLDANVQDVVCVVDRESGGAENLAREGLTLRALYRMSELEAAIGRGHAGA